MIVQLYRYFEWEEGRLKKIDLSMMNLLKAKTRCLEIGF